MLSGTCTKFLPYQLLGHDGRGNSEKIQQMTSTIEELQSPCGCNILVPLSGPLCSGQPNVIRGVWLRRGQSTV